MGLIGHEFADRIAKRSLNMTQLIDRMRTINDEDSKKRTYNRI